MVIETEGRAIDAVLCSSARLDFPDLVPVEEGFRVGGFQSIQCLPFAQDLQRAQGFHVAVVAQTDGVHVEAIAVQNCAQQSPLAGGDARVVDSENAHQSDDFAIGASHPALRATPFNPREASANSRSLTASGSTAPTSQPIQATVIGERPDAQHVRVTRVSSVHDSR
jgi:hypothetical protein